MENRNALNLTAPAFKKLNLGCGFDLRDGYVNVDFQAFHKPDLVADVRELSMLPSGWFEEILAQDVLEHLPRLDTPKALVEWNRLLCVNGLLFLRMPNIVGLAELLVSPENADIENQTLLVQCLFGTQAYTGDWHLTGFTEPLVRHYLSETGFEILTMGSRDHWLFDVTAQKLRSAVPTGGADPRRAAFSVVLLPEPSQEPVPVLGPAFYGWEGDWRKGAHSWSRGAATLVFVNSTSKMLEGRYSFSLNATAKRHVTVITPAETKTVELIPGSPLTVGPFDLRLQPGETPIRFETDRPAVPAGAGDPRPITFSVAIVAHSEGSRK
jgi:predicted SAM-dependent methyltransferase